jgi:hypothetical protein
MRQIHAGKRASDPPAGRKRRCHPTRATPILFAPIRSPAAPASPAPGPSRAPAAGSATCPAAGGRPPNTPRQKHAG